MLLVISAALLFACNDTATKHLTLSYPVPVIVAVRFAFQLGLMIAILGPARGRQLYATRRTGLVIVRAFCLAAASLLLGLGLHLMPVAESTAIVFLAPIIVVVIARPLLDEHIGAAGWAAAIAGFIGVLLIVRPGGGLDPLGLAYVLGCCAVSVVYILLSRILAVTETTLAMIFWIALVGTLCFGAIAPFFWGGPPPNALEVGLLLSTGVTSGVGHFMLTAAFRYAPASLLAPVQYVQLIWAGALGWIVFGHIPDGLAIVGMLVIAASGVAMAVQSRLARPPVTRA